VAAAILIAAVFPASSRPYQGVSSGYAMVSVNFKLVILTVLANWPTRPAAIDEIRREVGIIIADEDQAEQLRRLSAIGDFDDAGLSGFVTTTGGSSDWDGPEGRPNNVAAAYSPRYARRTVAKLPASIRRVSRRLQVRRSERL